MGFLSKIFKNRNEIKVNIMHAKGGEDLPLPQYKTSGAAGMDLHENIPKDKPITLGVGEFMVIPTGICIELPPYVEAQVRARSGNAKDYGISLVNGIGTIDVDYRGEIGAIIMNMGHEPFTIHRGDRIAQLVFNEYKRVKWVKVNALSGTVRGTKGYGSTKLKDN